MNDGMSTARKTIWQYEQDDEDNMVREALMDFDDVFALDIPERLRNAVRDLSTDELSELRLMYSLCPLHGIDYAICFDDEDPECEPIRRVFPSYDS